VNGNGNGNGNWGVGSGTGGRYGQRSDRGRGGRRTRWSTPSGMIFPSNQPGAGYHSNAGMNGFHQPFINRTGGLPMQPTPHLPLHLPPQQPQPQHPNLPPPHPGSYHYESDRRAQSISLTSINDFLDPGSPKRKNYRPGLMEQLTLKEDEGQVVPGDSGLEEKAVQRKHYHPAAPANRSEWVMWVGNVPNNGQSRRMSRGSFARRER
jgi:hypothetical protein